MNKLALSLLFALIGFTFQVYAAPVSSRIKDTLKSVPIAEPLPGPTRGFLLERGAVMTDKSLSLDLQSGYGQSGGAIRLVLPSGELILNSEINGTSANEAIFKMDAGQWLDISDQPFSTAFYFGLAHVDFESSNSNQDFDYTNAVVGMALSMQIEQLILDINPEIELADDMRDDTILNLGLGAFYDMGATQVGRILVGGELVIVEGGDEKVDPDVDDDLLSLGFRWHYLPNVTLDLMLIRNGREDITSFPGVLRLNVLL